MTVEADARWAVIVGSGFGAAVTACRLAQAYVKNPTDAYPPERAEPGAAPTRDTRTTPELSKSICILERGRRYGREDFPRVKLPDYLTQDPEMRTSRRVPEVSRLLWGVDQGLFDLRNLGKLQLVQSAGYGGGSLIYANVQLRPPAQVFADWPPEYRELDERGQKKAKTTEGSPLDDEFERVAQWLGVQPLPEKLREQYPKTRLMQSAAQRLKRADDLLYPPLAIRFGADGNANEGERTNSFGKSQRPCNGCGNCVVGCQEQAKNTLDLNYLAEAERLGVEVRTLSEVMRIEAYTPPKRSKPPHPSFEPPAPDPEPRFRLTYFDHLEGAERVVLAHHVFLGAGAVGTTQLLLRCKNKLCPAELDPDHDPRPKPKQTGLDHVGEGFFANGDSVGIVFDTERPAEPSHGPTITTTLLHVDPLLESTAAKPGVQQARSLRPRASGGKLAADAIPVWFLIQDGGMAPSLERALGYFQSPLWGMRNRLTRAASSVDLRNLFARAPTLADQGLADVATAVASIARWVGGREHMAQREPATLPTEWLQFLPQPLRSAIERALGVSDFARDQTSRLEDRVLDKMGPSTLFMSRLVDPQKLREHIADAVSELYPPLKHLLREHRGLDLAVSVLTHVLLGDRQVPAHALPLLAMGPDQRGVLEMKNGRLIAKWERPDVQLFGLQERLMRDVAVELGGELRTNPNWTLGRKPVTVHAQGGCGMGAKGSAATDEVGEVHGIPGLYVVDAAGFPSSVGVNPSSTIAAVAERKVSLFLKKTDAAARTRLNEALAVWALHLDPDPQQPKHAAHRIEVGRESAALQSAPVSLKWSERMTGWVISPDTSSQTVRDAADKQARDVALQLEPEGKKPPDPDLPYDFRSIERANLENLDESSAIVANLTVVIEDAEAFVRSFGLEEVSAKVWGTVQIGTTQYRTFDASGVLEFVHDDSPPQVAPATGAPPTPKDLIGLRYELSLRDAQQQAYTLIGRKLFHDDPGQDVWPDVTTLYFVLTSPQPGRSRAGVMRVGLQDFLLHQLPGMDVYLAGEPGRCPSAGAESLGMPPPPAKLDARFAPDEAARAWALLRFGQVCFGGIQNVYERWF